MQAPTECRRLLLLILMAMFHQLFTAALPPPSTNRVPDLSQQLASLSGAAGTMGAVNATVTKRRKRRKRKAKTALPDNDAPRIRPNDAGLSAKKPQNVRLTETSGGREGACLRRIKHEWRDAVQLGIAYDWTNMKTVKPKAPVISDKYSYVRIGPLGKNLLRWHFSVQGCPHSDYESGVYHGRVLLPKDYPMSPPRVQVLTPSGRFITGQDICLSASAYHPESWTPKWTVISLVDALRLHMLTTANEIGGKDASPEERRRLARGSRTWHIGHIDHQRMIRDGTFPWHDEDGEMSEEEARVDNEGTDGGVQVTVKRTPEQVQVRKRVPVIARILSILIRSVAKVLVSPTRLAMLLLLAVFVLLNRR